MKRILLLYGPNLNLTGTREPQIYGSETLEEINRKAADFARERGAETVAVQSNHEGVLIDELHATPGRFDAVILNAGALTHYSYALRDAIAAIPTPVVELHFSNIFAREEFRRISVLAPVCKGQISGFGTAGLFAALELVIGA